MALEESVSKAAALLLMQGNEISRLIGSDDCLEGKTIADGLSYLGRDAANGLRAAFDQVFHARNGA